MLNKISLIGRLGRDAELKSMDYGNTVCNFSIATDESYKDRDGRKHEQTQWFEIALWGKLGQAIAQYLTKGTLVYVEGKIRSREYTDKEGVRRWAWTVTADQVRMLGGGRRNEDNDAQETGGGDTEFNFGAEDDVP